MVVTAFDGIQAGDAPVSVDILTTPTVENIDLRQADDQRHPDLHL